MCEREIGWECAFTPLPTQVLLMTTHGFMSHVEHYQVTQQRTRWRMPTTFTQRVVGVEINLDALARCANLSSIVNFPRTDRSVLVCVLKPRNVSESYLEKVSDVQANILRRLWTVSTNHHFALCGLVAVPCPLRALFCAGSSFLGFKKDGFCNVLAWASLSGALTAPCC